MCGKSAKTQKGCVQLGSWRCVGGGGVYFMANLHMCGCTHSFACQMSLGDYGNFLGLCHGWVFNFAYFPRHADRGSLVQYSPSEFEKKHTLQNGASTSNRNTMNNF